MSKVVDCQILPNPNSDHLRVELTIALHEQLKGRGFWKLNNSLLHDKNYLDEINKIIDLADYRYDNQDVGMKWELTKMDIIEFSQNYSINKAKERRKLVQEGEDKLNKLHKKLACINLSSDNAIKWIEKINQKIDEVQKELNKHAIYKTQGAIIRLKARYYELGETPSKYFLGLEKRNATNKIMSQIYKDNGQIIQNPKEILREQKDFFRKLYTSDNKVNFSFPVKLEQQVSEDFKQQMEGEVTEKELGEALNLTSNNKSPSPCGLTANFLKVFWLRLKSWFVKLTNFAFTVHKIHNSARFGIITLIPKGGRDSRWLKNWHPIILLSVDYKLIAKVIANRIKSVISDIINKDQAGFIQGRGCAHNIRKIIDVVKFTQEKQLNALLLLVDFEKAFDRVEYRSLFRIMELFNFGPNMVRWLEILFDGFKLCTVNNGYSSPYFEPTRGLFQGNPVSPYGFILVIEMLAIMLRANPKVEGIRIGKFNTLLSMFADDMSIFIPNKQVVWLEVKATLEYFREISGLRVNYEKSVMYRLGSARKANAKFYSKEKLHWTNDPVKVLGCYISANDDEMLKLNLNPIFQKVQSLTDLWSCRNMSLIGKVLVLNSLIASLFVYKLKILPSLPIEYLQKFEKLANDFIWDQKKPKIPLKILQGNKDQGGLGLINLQAKQGALKAQWIFDIQQNDIMKYLADYFLGNKANELLWQTNMLKEDVKKHFKVQNFWMEVLESWNDIKYLNPVTEQEIRLQIIWFNSNIKI